MTSASSRILCMDFDGVINSYTSGWQGTTTISDPPVPGAFEFLKKAILDFEVHIFSSRSQHMNGIRAMQDWFISHGWPGTLLTGPEDLHFPNTKPPAFISIDDRAITFTGEWPEIATLSKFKPWYQEE